MKKKLLFLIFLLIPFIVNAEDVKDYSLKWVVESNKEYSLSFNNKDTFVKYTYDNLISIDRITGNKNTVSLNDSNYVTFIDNKYFVISENYSGRIEINTYDTYLKKLSSVTTDPMTFISWELYNEDYILVSATKKENNSYYLVIMFVDKDGKIAKQDKIETYYEVYRTDREDKQYCDFNANCYKINNYKLEPYEKNSDGSYLIATNNYIYKYSSTGEKIGSVEIPNGKGTRMAKKGDYYYVETGIYETDSDNRISVSLDLYLIDENLNIIKTANIPAPDIKFNCSNETGLLVESQGIYNKNDNIIAYLYYEYSKKAGYVINENLEIVSQENDIHPLYRKHFNHTIYDTESSSFYTYDEEAENSGIYLTNNEYDAIKAKLRDDENFNHISAHKYNNKYYVTEYFEKCEGPGCDLNVEGNKKVYEKASLLWYDLDLNEIYRNDIYDWELTYEYDSTTLKGESYDKITLGTTPYGDYYIIAGSSNKDNLLQVVDQEGNIIKDFSKDIEKYKELNISRIYTTEKGIYVYLSFRSYESGYRGATATIEDDEVDSKILGESKVLATLDTRVPSDGIYNAMLYFTVNYKVDKNISGKGTITSTVEKAEEGEQVRFTVTPDKGYVLSYVKVIDSNGNILTFTDNTFVMPASNVVIEAVFTPTNPNTGDIAIFAIIMISLVSAFILLTQKKKMNSLK